MATPQEIKDLIQEKIANIQKDQTEPTMEADGIRVERVSFKKIDRENEIREYQNLSSQMMFYDDYKCDFKTSYIKNETEKEYKKSFEKFCENFENFRYEGFGIYMSGEVGTGKSHYTNCIYNKLKDKYIVYKTSLQTLFDEIIEKFGEKTATSFLRERLGKAEIIILEDLGNEFMKDWAKQNMFFIFNFLFNARKSVIINTNLSDDQASDFFRIMGTDKLFSRLKSKCKYYKFDWEDRRIGMYKDEIDKWY